MEVAVQKQKRVRTRMFLEVDGDNFILVEKLWEHPNKKKLLEQAAGYVKQNIKQSIQGLGPLFGKKLLLDIVAEIIDEDFDEDGPQTPTRGDEYCP